MTIIEKIRASIQAVHGSDFKVYYHDDVTLNELADTMELPSAIVTLITQGTIDEQSGQYREVVSAAVFFVDKSEFDFDADENEKIIDQCKRRCLRWLAALPMDDELAALDGYDIAVAVGVVDFLQAPACVRLPLNSHGFACLAVLAVVTFVRPADSAVQDVVFFFD